MAEESLNSATIEITPHMEKDDRMRWVNSQMRESQGGQRVMDSQLLRGPNENPPATFAGLPVIIEKAG